jgi:hypothetical protein
MKTIYKYPVDLKNESSKVELPLGAKFLTIALQHGTVQMWFEVYDQQPKIEQEFRVVGTGWEIPEGWEYLGTCLNIGQSFVWHLYRKV